MDYLDIHNKAIVIDAHSDIPLDIYYSKKKGISGIVTDKHLPLLKKGGVNLVIVNLYSEFHPEGSLKQALIELGELYKELNTNDSLRLIKTSADLDEVIKGDKIGFVLSLEGLEPISNDLNLLQVFYELGLRSASLTWNYRNYFASGAWETGGLSELGKKAVKEMERLGIIVDVSHLNEEGFWDVVEIVEKPIIASHSNARALYDHPRNLTDDQIKAIVNTGGVIGVNNYFTEDDDISSIDTYLKHIDYLLEKAGEDHVGLGFDFNGYIGERTTRGLEDASTIPNVTRELLNKNLGINIVEKVLGKNFLRIINGVL